MTAPTLLEEAQERAAAATETAQQLRARLGAGEDVDSDELDRAERAEEHTGRRLAAVEALDQERQQREAAEALAEERAELQTLWPAVQREPAEVAELREQAVASCRNYLAAVVAWMNEKDSVRDRVEAAGFRVRGAQDFRRSPLPGLARAILAGTRDLLDGSWTRPRLDQKTTIWEGSGA